MLIWPAFIFPIFFLTEDSIWLKAALKFAIILLSLVVLIKQPLRVVDYKKNRFWINGCCPEFLESLESEFRQGW